MISILLADDDDDDQKLFSDAIQETGQQVILNIVNDGNDLINHFSKPEIKIPNILFLDINMPQRSGLQCLSVIRSNKLLESMAVVIYSTSSHKPDIEETFSKGANLYFMKPNSFVQLVQSLKDIMKLDWNDYAPKKNFEKFVYL
jgi:CheY-like chemotaxis protein